MESVNSISCLPPPLYKLRKAQSDFNTNQASSQEAEEGAHNAPVLAKQQSSDGKKHCGQRMNKKKRVKPIQQNPYINPYM